MTLAKIRENTNEPALMGKLPENPRIREKKEVKETLIKGPYDDMFMDPIIDGKCDKLIETGAEIPPDLDREGRLKLALLNINGWVGVGSSKELYDQGMVLTWARYAHQHMRSLTMIMAHELKIHNVSDLEGTEAAIKLKEFKLKALTAKHAIEKTLRNDQITSTDSHKVRVVTWEEMIDELHATSDKKQRYDELKKLLLRFKNDNEHQFRDELENIVIETRTKLSKANKEIQTSPEEIEKRSEYAFQEVLMSLTMAEIADCEVKLGHEGEKLYDQLTGSVFLHGRTAQCDEHGDYGLNKKFGTLYFDKN